MANWKYALAGVIVPLFWWIVLSVSLWITRRLFPRAEQWLFVPLGTIFRRLYRASRRRA